MLHNKLTFWERPSVKEVHLNYISSVWVFIWLLIWKNSLAQKLHLKRFSLEWDFMWSDKISFRKNPLVHKIHLNVVFTCWHETCSSENNLAQKLHLNGFSLKWVFMWPGKISFWKITLVHKIHLNVVFKCWHEICSRENYLAQRLHLNGFSSEWLFMWPD